MGTHNCLSPMEPRHEENRGKVLPMELKSRNRCGKEPRNVRDIGQNWLWLSSSVAAATQTLSCPPELPGSPESSLVRQKERRKGALGWLWLGQFFSGGDNRALWRQPALSPSFPTRTQWPLKGSPRCLWNGWNERVSKRRCKLCSLSLLVEITVFLLSGQRPLCSSCPTWSFCYHFSHLFLLRLPFPFVFCTHALPACSKCLAPTTAAILFCPLSALDD